MVIENLIKERENDFKKTISIASPSQTVSTTESHDSDNIENSIEKRENDFKTLISNSLLQLQTTGYDISMQRCINHTSTIIVASWTKTIL